jgi:cell division protein FtsQ
MRVAAMVLAVIAVAAGVVAIYQSSLFAVTDVEVIGNETLSVERVIEVASVPPDTTLLRFGGSGVKERLESDPWIAGATVTRDFPDTMRIRIEERSPVAYVDLGGETFWAVDEGGFFLAEETPDASSTLVVVRDIEGLEPELGIASDSEVLGNALDVTSGLSEELSSMVRAVSAPTVDKTTLITNDDIEILVGSAEDIERRDRVARQILDEQAGTVLYINVRTVDRPTWRGIGE